MVARTSAPRRAWVRALDLRPRDRSTAHGGVQATMTPCQQQSGYVRDDRKASREGDARAWGAAAHYSMLRITALGEGMQLSASASVR